MGEVKDALSGVIIASKNGGNKKKKRKRGNNDDSDEDWDAGSKAKRRRRNNSNNEEDDNPMPDFTDIMTGVGVVKPAISPYGHVLGYDTWTKILRTSKHKNMCPFTLQK